MNHGIQLHLWLLRALLLCGSLSANDESHVLTSVAEIRGLSAEEAAKGRPVRLRATVSFISYGDGWFKVHDGEEGISVDLEVARKRGIWSGRSFTKADNVLGVVLEIDGITGTGSYSPIVIPAEIRRIGTGPVPEARRVSMEQLISGSEVSQRVEVEGVVWGAGAWRMASRDSISWWRAICVKRSSCGMPGFNRINSWMRGFGCAASSGRSWISDLRESPSRI